VINNNFEYLDDRITTTGSAITTVQSNLASVSSTINSRIDGVDEDIEDLAYITNPTITTLSSSGTINIEDNSIDIITPSAAVTFVLPSVTDVSTFHQILVQVNLTTVQSIDVGTEHFFNGKTPELSSVGKYNLVFEFDINNSFWVCGWMRKS
jgi:hypothetical protein